MGTKGQQIWKYSYQIDRNPYKGLGFDNQDEITRYSRDPIAPVLPSYKPKMTGEVQNLFDSILITKKTALECAEHRISDLSNNVIYENSLSLEVPTQNHPIDPDRMECLHQYAIELGEDPEQFSIVTEAEKKMLDGNVSVINWKEMCVFIVML